MDDPSVTRPIRGRRVADPARVTGPVMKAKAPTGYEAAFVLGLVLGGLVLYSWLVLMLDARCGAGRVSVIGTFGPTCVCDGSCTMAVR